MKPLLRRVLQGAGAAGLVIALGSGPASAGIGTRLANGDGDTRDLCMSIVNAGRGTSVEMEPCNLNAHQGWELKTEDGVWFWIVSQDGDAAGRCLTSHGEGVRVTMDRCSTQPPGSDNYEQQIWARTQTSSGWYQYRNARWAEPSRQCLDVRDNGRSNVVQSWLCGPTTGPNIKGNQQWKFW